MAILVVTNLSNPDQEWSKKFWGLSPGIWSDTIETVSVCWLASMHAARLTAKKGYGLIVHVTDN